MQNLQPELIRGYVKEYLKESLLGKNGRRLIIGDIVSNIMHRLKEFVNNPGKKHDYNMIQEEITAITQEFLWGYSVQRLIVWGSRTDRHASHPHFWITEMGKKSIFNDERAEPYDPDRFMEIFDKKNQNVDLTIREYLKEAIKTFNSNCFRATAVMLGCASEKLFYLLFDEFVDKITDTQKKKKFETDSKGINITKKFETLDDKLQKISKIPKKLPDDVKQVIKNDFRNFFNLIKNNRNGAGHPQLGATEDRDYCYHQLVIFPHYTENVYKIINYFKNENGVDW